MKEDIKGTVFIVEDDAAYAMMIEKAILNDMPKLDVHRFLSVERAISQNKLNPDVVILDHFLKHTNGIEAIPVVRDFINTASIAVLSSQTKPELFSKAFEEGAKDYILKDKQALGKVVDFVKKEVALKDVTVPFWKTIFNDWMEEAAKKTKHVAIVDDDEGVLLALKYNLSRNAVFKVETFVKFNDLLDKNELVPDVVILDYQIGNDVLTPELIGKIKTKFPSALLVCLSTNQAIEVAVLLKASGIDYYLQKSYLALKSLRKILFNG